MANTLGTTRSSGQTQVVPVVRILAVGSPYGDDRVSWHVVERLRRNPLPGVEAVVLSDPVRVLDYLEGCERLVVVDACRSGAEPGTILRMVWPDPRLHEHAGSSTHGFGVVRVLELADQLNWLPPYVVLIGIEADACYPAAEVSRPVRLAFPKLYRQVLAETRGHATSTPARRERQAHEVVTRKADKPMSESMLQEVLRPIRFLEGVTEDELRQIASVAQLAEYPAGKTLFREGERLSSIFLVIEGSVALELPVPGRGYKRIHTVGPGELLGWSPLLNQLPMTATARALAPTCFCASMNTGPAVSFGYDLLLTELPTLCRSST